MDLYAVLAQVSALLQREGRVSYRALKVQFSLDDDQLEALKDELIEAKRLAVDERGRVLVWVGEAPPAEPPTLHPAPAVPLPDTRPDHPVYSAPLTTTPPAPDAERRPLTVMFCDLVDSTRLAQQLDPEDYRAVVRAYQEAAVAALQPFEGYVAQYLGDGLLVYFGYPQAHEDAAQRAVRAGLAIVDAMVPLNTRLEPQYGVRVAVRLGLHTGVAVVGSVGSGARQEQLAMGDTPNIAARLQGLAAIVAMGNELSRPRWLLLLAEATGHVGQVAEGLCLLAEALAAIEAGGQGDLMARTYLLQGELLLRQTTPDAAQAKACWKQALAIARRQRAKSWELRAAMSLSRLWQQQGKRAEAYELLAPVYGWFTEGFDTADLQDAKALLEGLGM
jgi:class 3 adenylate cyclase